MIYYILQVRMESSRTPGKSVALLEGKPSFIRVAERARVHIPGARVLVSTTTSLPNDAIAYICDLHGIEVVRDLDAHDSGVPRLAAVIDRLGLDDGDVVALGAGDTPFTYGRMIGFLADEMADKGCHFFRWRENPFGKLIGGVAWPYTFTAGGFRMLYERWKYNSTTSWVRVCGAGLKWLLSPIPKRLALPWPWRPVFLDYPEQVAQARVIFEELDAPVDVFELWELFDKKPQLAHMTDGCPKTTGYGQHKDWFWDLDEGEESVRVDIPEGVVV